MKYKTDDLAQALLKRRINESVDDLGSAVKVLQSGKVKIGKAFKVKEFNDDDGWVTTTIKPGEYDFRLLDIRGWKPRQIKVDNAWVDVQNLCQEIEGLIHEGKSIDNPLKVGDVLILNHNRKFKVKKLDKKNITLTNQDGDDYSAPIEYIEDLLSHGKAHITEGVTKDKFLDYVRIQYSGVTNMWDVRTVCDLSTEGLTKDDCLDIIKNYSVYQKKWCKD